MATPPTAINNGFADDALALAATESNAAVVMVPGLVAPTISVPSPNFTTDAGEAPAPFAADTIADAYVDTPIETLTVTPSAAANGKLSDPNAATDRGSINTITGVYTVIGTAAQVTTALDGLLFTPVRSTQQMTTTFTISDTSSVYPYTITNSATEVTEAPNMLT